MQGKKFIVADVPADLAEKREKLAERKEKKKEAESKLREVNKDALAKKIAAQLDGLDLLEQLTNELIRLGMGIARYGDVRRFDPAPLLPLIEELFVQGALALFAAAGCDDSAAKPVLIAIDDLNKVALRPPRRKNDAKPRIVWSS